MMRILVLQHVGVEHPGILRDYFRRDGIAWDTVELDQGEEIPPLEPYDMMLVMGGPQDVWQEAEHPWLVQEKAAIRRFVVDMKRSYLGICLGHQLLAVAIGGNVELAASAEVGVMPVAMTPAGRADPFFDRLSDPLTVLQWHSAEVTALPKGTEILASSDACQVQAFRYGPHAYGLQCHVEITQDTVPDWAAIPEYAAALEKMLGEGATQSLQEAVARQLPDFNRDAEILYRNFMAIIQPKMSGSSAKIAYV
jgi:GMP synthase-like glutamine amidotransferase